MDVESLISKTLFFAAAPALSAAIGWAYFVQSSQRASLVRRFVSSAYGPSIAVLFLAVLFLVPSDFRYAQHVSAFFWLQSLPAALFLYSVARYPGPRRMHVFALVAIPSWVWLVIFGFLKIHGE